jgi:pseudouridine-5'-phosphate glycosidase
VTGPVSLSDEVAAALAEGTPVVGLETTIVAHGFPRGEGVAVGRACEAQVRAGGGVPATIGVLAGRVQVGLSEAELELFGPDARKVGPRDVAACCVQGGVGATTAGATLAVCRLAGIRFFATGGIGGVHRGFPSPPDVSADLGELAGSAVLVVSAGVKSLLDVPATAEVLETLGVPLLGWRTNSLPLFYSADGGPPVSARVESAAEAAEVARTHWRIGGGGLLLARPPEDGIDAEPLIEEALERTRREGVSGQAITPFVLGHLHERSGGRTQEVNRRLVVANAALAAEVARAFAELERPSSS